MISDGDDNMSHVTRREALWEAIDSGTLIISINASKTSGVGPRSERDRAMEELAKRTGGKFFSVWRERELPGVFANALAELSALYLVTYTPLADNNNGVEVEINSSGRERLDVAYPKRNTKR